MKKPGQRTARPASACWGRQFPVDLVPQCRHHVERVAKRREHDRRDRQERRRGWTGVVRLHDELRVGWKRQHRQHCGGSGDGSPHVSGVVAILYVQDSLRGVVSDKGFPQLGVIRSQRPMRNELLDEFEAEGGPRFGLPVAEDNSHQPSPPSRAKM
jgi:hypothetical protein